MAIILDERTRLVVQGITGNQGHFHTAQMLNYGTKIVAGVSPGKGGGTVEGIPVYDTVAQAVAEKGVERGHGNWPKHIWSGNFWCW